MSNPVFNALTNTIAEAANSEKLAAHMKGFVRTARGSYVVGLNDMSKTVNFLYEVSESAVEASHEEVNEECPGAAREGVRYFRFDIPNDFVAYEGVALLEDIGEDFLSEVRVRMGAHGYELYIPRVKFNPGRVASGWIILGPTEGVEGDIVYTWYPGRMTAGQQLDKYAVKLVTPQAHYTDLMSSAADYGG